MAAMPGRGPNMYEPSPHSARIETEGSISLDFLEDLALQFNLITAMALVTTQSQTPCFLQGNPSMIVSLHSNEPGESGSRTVSQLSEPVSTHK